MPPASCHECHQQWLEVSKSSETNSNGNNALQRSQEKLRQYMSENSTARFRQPAVKFFTACQVFDPEYSRIVNVDTGFVFQNIPWFEEDDLAKAELRMFLSSINEFNSFDHPVDFWIASVQRFPKLSKIALSCLSIPAGSVAAERSFSLYSKVLRDDRRSMSEQNLPKYNMLYQNSGRL